MDEIRQEAAVGGRGIGVLEMVRAIAEHRPHIVSGEVGRHVLDVMLSVEESAADSRFVAVDSSAPPIPPLPTDFDPLARTISI